MKTIIQTPRINARVELIDFINEKVGKLKHLSERILEAQVVLKTDKSDSRNNKVCEIKLVIPGNDLFARCQSDTFEEAVQQAVHACGGQVRKWKNKLEERKTTAPSSPEER